LFYDFSKDTRKNVRIQFIGFNRDAVFYEKPRAKILKHFIFFITGIVRVCSYLAVMAVAGGSLHNTSGPTTFTSSLKGQ
jgi:hypothetical protein